MSERIAAGLLLGTVMIGLCGNGLGSGWVRLGPPGDGPKVAPTANVEAPPILDPPLRARHPVASVPTYDPEATRTQATSTVPPRR